MSMTVHNIFFEIHMALLLTLSHMIVALQKKICNFPKVWIYNFWMDTSVHSTMHLWSKIHVLFCNEMVNIFKLKIKIHLEITRCKLKFVLFVTRKKDMTYQLHAIFKCVQYSKLPHVITDIMFMTFWKYFPTMPTDNCSSIPHLEIWLFSKRFF